MADVKDRDVEQIPELVRDAEKSATGTADTSEPPAAPADTHTRSQEIAEPPRTDELEALWPGVHQDFIHPGKKSPSFHVMLGFIAGAVVSLLGVWGYTIVTPQLASSPADNDNQVLVAKADDGATSTTPAQAQVTVKATDPGSVIVPISNTYEVKSGDTLVSIALKNYRKVTPRIIDSIVETNGLKNANVLNLGQKLKLPNYKPQIAASGQVN